VACCGGAALGVGAGSAFAIGSGKGAVVVSDVSAAALEAVETGFAMAVSDPASATAARYKEDVGAMFSRLEGRAGSGLDAGAASTGAPRVRLNVRVCPAAISTAVVDELGKPGFRAISS
jgi:hypothetical protein